MNTKQKHIFAFTAILLPILLTFGCQQSAENKALDVTNKLLDKDFENPPKMRLGCYATPTIGTNYLEPDNLGVHNYKFNLKEKNGIVYTCKAGHVDISHLREAADWTAYLSAKVYKNLHESNFEFSYKLKEGSVCLVNLKYPDYWQNISPEEKERITFDVAVKLGRYLANTAGTWHEILTWYGYKSKMLFSEFPSAFSWEDTFSNLIGSNIGADAMRDMQHSYEEYVTLAVDELIKDFGGQSAELAKEAAEMVNGVWFTGKIPPFVNMMKRNFDIGLGDGYVTAIRIDSITECPAAAAPSYEAPNLKFLAEYGFAMKLQIEPKVWEEDKIFKVVYQDNKTEYKYIEPEKHFPQIMSDIQNQAKIILLSLYNSKPVSRRLYN